MTDDPLARAEALYRRDLSFEEWYDLSRDMWPELIAEIKHLQSFADDLMGNCNILRSRAQNAEAQIQWLGALAFMKNLPADQIIDHFISWGNAAYEDQKRQAAYVARLEAAFLKLYISSIPGLNDAEEHARRCLERIKRGEQE